MVFSQTPNPITVTSYGSVWDMSKDRNPDSTDEKSRIEFDWNCYFHPTGKYFQDIIKTKIINSIEIFHSNLVFNFDGEYIKLHNILSNSFTSHIGNDLGGEYKKEFMRKFADIIVYFIQNPEKIDNAFQNKIINSMIIFSHNWIKKVYNKKAYVFEDERLQTFHSYLCKSIPTITKRYSILLKIIDIIIFLMKEDIYYRPRFIKILQEINNPLKSIALKSPQFSILKDISDLSLDMKFTHFEIANLEDWK